MILATFHKLPTLDDLLKIVPDLKLVLFDMDGTLVDSEHEHALAVIDVLKKITSVPFTPEEIFPLVFGCPDPYSFESLKKLFSFDTSLSKFLDLKHQALDDIMANNIQEVHPLTKEAKKLIESLHSHPSGIKSAVVTASERRTAEVVLKNNFEKLFPLYFGREDTERSKPFPDPYWNAVTSLRKIHGTIEHHQIVIIEDSPFGLAAALSSGLHVIHARWFYKDKSGVD